MLAEQPHNAPFAAASQTLFKEVAAVLLDASADTEHARAAAYPRLAATLASSLQLLKAADEELARRNIAAQEREAALELELVHERRVFDALGVPIVISDPSGTVLTANSAARKLLGVDEQEMIGISLATFVSSDDRADFRTMLTRLRSVGETPDWHVRVQPRRHSPLTMRASVVVIEGGNRRTGTATLSWCFLPANDVGND